MLFVPGLAGRAEGNISPQSTLVGGSAERGPEDVEEGRAEVEAEGLWYFA